MSWAETKEQLQRLASTAPGTRIVFAETVEATASITQFRKLTLSGVEWFVEVEALASPAIFLAPVDAETGIFPLAPGLRPPCGMVSRLLNPLHARPA
jgi:hypothetical protein